MKLTKAFLSKLYQSLDDWVSKNGNGKYYSNNFITKEEDELVLNESYGIQQNRKEIFSFISEIVKINKKNICLEIGLGHSGSTHFLFRHIFKKTITIELDKNRVFDFRDRLTKYYKKYVLDDGKSHFVYGSSSDANNVSKIVNFLKNEKVDLLFVDGSHYFKDVLVDWMIYKNLVNKNGMIAFHDCNSQVNEAGVPKLIKFIKKNYKDINIKKIVHSKNMGIAYYILK